MAAFVATLDDAASHLQLPTERIDLFGFSGGAQFVHRFAMLAPAPVRRAVVASAGWYTYLDQDRPFPRGVAPGERSGGRPVDVDAFLRIPMHVLVGERDVEQDLGLRTGKAIDRRQGPNRLARALRWMDHLEEAARARGLPPRVSFDLLTDTGHSFSDAAERGGLVDRTFDFLHPTPGPPDPIDDRDSAAMTRDQRLMAAFAALATLAVGVVGAGISLEGSPTVLAVSRDVPLGPDGRLSVTFVGDTLLGDAAQQLIDQRGNDWPFDAVRPALGPTTSSPSPKVRSPSGPGRGTRASGTPTAHVRRPRERWPGPGSTR